MGRWKHSVGLAHSRRSAVDSFFISRSPLLGISSLEGTTVLQEGAKAHRGKGHTHGHLGPGPC